ncbi:MAG TPA: glycosyltransferase family 4 protein [Methylomirabilota bacterium]|jgi:glycosyltransferase involved in cell wall biosynthesis|nr:glycosyltransferase family 4 protein [Methylomirabilota bacterium]
MLRIAQITSVSISVPPGTHGGTERMVYQLTEGLVRRGHAVELFASGDSRVSCPVRSVTPTALLDRPDWSTYLEREYEAMNAFQLFRQAERFDLIHAHWPCLAPYFSPFMQIPMVLTYHYISPESLEFYETRFPRCRGVFVSRAQAVGLDRPHGRVIHNAVRGEDIPYGDGVEDRLIIVARMAPRKGIAEAIRIARQAGKPLLVIAPVMHNLAESPVYFRDVIAPLIDGKEVCYVPGLSNDLALQEVGRSRAFLFPLQWEEPFGLAVLEAMVTGTPVITYRRGGMLELVEDGVTGFLVDNEDEMLAAIREVGTIDRRRCRERALARFSVERMVKAYEQLYYEILAEHHT